MRVTFGSFTFDEGTRQLLKGGAAVPLPPRVFDLLRVLLAHRPRALSKSELMDALWPKTFVSESNLASLVNDLRAALGDDAKEPEWVRTVYGFGYAFSGAVAAAGARAAAPERHFLMWAGRQVALPEGASVLGRDGSADVVIADGSISRRHARLDVRDEGATLEDLESKNGTWVNGERLTGAVVLASGDEFRLGSVVLRFLAVPLDGTTETRA